MSEDKITEKKAREIYDTATRVTISHYYRYKDQTEKAFLFMLHKLNEEKKFYENCDLRFYGKNGKEEILRIINSHIDMLEKQLGIITKGLSADAYKYELTIEDIKNKNLNYMGFGTMFCDFWQVKGEI